MRCRCRGSLPAVALGAALLASPVASTDPCADPRDADCAIARARAQVGAGHAAEAISLLKPALRAHPASRPLTLWLARAYLDDGNALWAWRTLEGYLRRQPDDCEAGLWLVYALVQQAALDDAAAALDGLRCPRSGPLATRRALLQALIGRHQAGPGAATSALARARQGDQAYVEDRVALAQLSAQLDPAYGAPIRGRLVVGGGYTSNALAGSPADPADTDRARQSPLGDLDLGLRLRSPWALVARPRLDVDLRLIGFAAAAPARDLSQASLGLGPSLLLGRDALGLLVRYRFDALGLAGGDRYSDGPLVFSNAHRLELELAPSPSVFAFGGGGRRVFRELGRGRLELDGGLAHSRPVGAWLVLSAALSGRAHDADRAAYDLVGLSSLLSADLRLPWELGLRLGALAGLDAFPASRDAFAPGRERHDLLTRVSLSGLSPSWRGLRGLLTYELARRDSTVPSYDFVEHRLLARLSWSFEHDPLLPAAIDPADHVPLPLASAQGDTSARDHVQELLRRDEALQRGSSCVE